MPNFLRQLVQTGALHQANPMEAYQNALKVKMGQAYMRGAELDAEGKLLEIGKGYLQRVQDMNEYPAYRDYMTKLGLNPSLLPESFESEGEFENWKLTAITSADELMKLRQGQKITINRVNDDGTTSELKVMPDQFESLRNAGLIDDKWRLGTVEGTPWKPTSRLEAESEATARGRDVVEGKYKETPATTRAAELQKAISLEQFKTRQQKELELYKSTLTKPDGKKADVLRKEFINSSKTFVEVRDAYNRIIAGAKEPSAAGDVALIFNYMKMLDPQSVVRESEYATAANAAGVPDKIRALYNRILKGERLAPDTRADFVDRSQTLYKEQLRSHQQLKSEYQRLANQFQIDPASVIVDYEISGQRENDPYEVGAVYEDANGVRKKYLGNGDWEGIK